MTQLEWEIKHYRQKMQRKQQLRFDFLMCLVVIFSIALGFVLSAVIDSAYGKEQFEKPDLWVGVSQEDFLASIEEEETEIVAEPIKEEWVYEDLRDEIDLLAYAICREAGNQSRECKLLVASVIVNRVYSNNHDFKNVNTIYEVLDQKGQFGKLLKGYKVRYHHPTADDYEVAEEILKNGTYNSKVLFFRLDRVVRNTTLFKKIGRVYFSY